jgi:trehalose 6-phosphate synthase/phosphatase
MRLPKPVIGAGTRSVTPMRHHALLRRMKRAAHLLLLLDYDGTLVPFASVPELAAPDEALMDLLSGLAARPHTEVHVVSGRGRDSLERFLGALPIGLHAEHGFWSRSTDGMWQSRPEPPSEWRQQVRDILDQATARTPGTLIEEKSVSLAWHYRRAEPDFGSRQAEELQRHLAERLRNAPVEILSGDKVIEIRPAGIHKGILVAALLERAPARTLLVAMGDDRTDEDLFAALPPGAVSIHVGADPSRAEFRLADVASARQLLAALLADEPLAK